MVNSSNNTEQKIRMAILKAVDKIEQRNNNKGCGKVIICIKDGKIIKWEDHKFHTRHALDKKFR